MGLASKWGKHKIKKEMKKKKSIVCQIQQKRRSGILWVELGNEILNGGQRRPH